MNIGFVLLSYGVDEPAGMERSVAVLTWGLARLGHKARVIAAGPERLKDGPEILRLRSLELAAPLTDAALMAEVGGAAGLGDELEGVAADSGLDVVCWVDALWGLGYLGRPRGRRRSVLAIHVLDTNGVALRAALRHKPDAVIVPSEFIKRHARERGLESTDWRVVPNGLPEPLTPPPSEKRREVLRRSGPIRTVARLGREKGVLELIGAAPACLDRPFELVLAEAGFEAALDDQQRLRYACERAASRNHYVRIFGPLGWDQVFDYLAAASITIVPSLAESFGLVALESMSVGTPVVAFAVGNLPTLIRRGGVVVARSDGADGLWRSALSLLDDRQVYSGMSTSAVTIAQEYRSQAMAARWVEAALR